MKQLFLAAALLFSFSVFAQSDKYAGAMEKTIAQFESAKTIEELTAASAAFERIGDAEKTQWLPYYYAALTQAWIGWMPEITDKDKQAEKINALVAKAEAIEKNAEICAIKNMSATQQMLMDPQGRWMTYGQQASTALQEGMKLDPANPRLYYLQGMSVFNTPEQFGGGKEKAKPIFEKAVELFNAEKAKPMYPHWGKKETEDVLAQCK